MLRDGKLRGKVRTDMSCRTAGKTASEVRGSIGSASTEWEHGAGRVIGKQSVFDDS
jgi:hypothetical protein